MPELPEVETIRRDLQDLLAGKTITEVQVRDLFAITGLSPKGKARRKISAETFSKGTRGKRIAGFQRKGKYLVMEFEQGGSLLFHLRMTGQLLVRAPAGNERVTLCMDSGPALCYLDRRRFGEMWHALDWRKDPSILALGVEPLNGQFTAEGLKKLFKGRSGAVHAALLNQKLIAGLGNIYATEALHKAGIRPTKPAGRITAERLQALAAHILQVVDDSIKNRGYSMNTYVDAMGKKGRSQMFASCYGKEGLPCGNCKTIFKRKVISGRGVVYCGRCQK